MATASGYQTKAPVRLFEGLQPFRLICGVYEIHCLTDRRSYIGSSRNIINRIGDHLSVLDSEKHTNKELQAVWKMYGENAFVWLVLEECEPSLRIDIEYGYIKKRNPHNLYNTAMVDRNAPTVDVEDEIIFKDFESTILHLPRWKKRGARIEYEKEIMKTAAGVYKGAEAEHHVKKQKRRPLKSDLSDFFGGEG